MEEKFMEIPIKDIEYDQRENIRFDIGDLSSFMNSINQQRLMEPIEVSLLKTGKYKLVFGHRRVAACKKLGWVKIRAIITKTQYTREELMIRNAMENIHRKGIDKMELGRVCNELKASGYSKREMAAKLALPNSTVETALVLFDKAPQKFLVNVKNRGHSLKQSGLTPTVATKISRLHYGSDTRDKLYNLAQREDISSSELDLIIALMITYRLTPELAYKEIKKYKVFTFSAIVNKNELERIQKKEIKLSKELRKMLKTKYPKLIPDLKKKVKK